MNDSPSIPETASPDSRNGIPILCLALLCIGCVSSIFSFLVFRHYHLNNDIGSYIFAADTFSMGKVRVPIPEPDNPATRHSDLAPQFFRTWMVVPHSFNDIRADGGKHEFMYSRYPPGHPLMLMLCRALLGAYRLAPILLTMLSAVGLYLYLRLHEGKRAAGWGVVLLALSPFYLVYGASLLSHNSTLFFLVWGLLAYRLSVEATTHLRRAGFSLLAGLAYGMSVACRPLTGACFTIILMLRLLQKHNRRLGQLLPVALGGAVILGGLLWYNQATTGNALTIPFTQYWPRDKLGFSGWSRDDLSGLRPEQIRARKQEYPGCDAIGRPELQLRQHTPLKALTDIAQLLKSLNDFILAVPGALLLLPVLLLFYRNQLATGWQWHLGEIALIIGAYSLHHLTTNSLDWGPRYYYELILPIFCLLAPLLASAWQELYCKHVLLCRAGLLCVLVLGIVHILDVCREPMQRELESRDFRERISSRITGGVRKPAIVFLKPQHRASGRYVGQYLGHLLNHPWFNSDIIYAVNHGEKNNLLLQFYPGRYAYALDRQGKLVTIRDTVKVVPEVKAED